MLRLARYLKPYTLLILIAIALLFVQANADLALPDYLSRIVNVGIQQGGIEDAVPAAIRQSQMERLMLFVDAGDQPAVADAYTLIDVGSPDYDRYVIDYPALANEPVYVLNESGQAQIDALNPIMGKAIVVVAAIEQVATDPARAAEMAGALGFDLSKIPAGADPFTAISQLPAARRAPMIDAISAQFAVMGDSAIVQAAAIHIKAEYEALGVDATRLQNDYILRIGGLMLVITLLSAVCIVAVGYLAARTAAGFARDIRRAQFARVESFSNTEFDRFSTASLITRSTNDVTQLQMIVFMMIRMVFFAPILGIGGILRIMERDSSMWWLIAVAVLTLMIIIVSVFYIALPRFKLIQKLVDRLNLVAREQLAGMMVIRAFNRQPLEEERFDHANLDLTAITLFINRLMVIMMPLMMLIMNGLSLAIIWIGSHQVAQAAMQVGDMMAFLEYSMQIMMSFLMLSMMFIMLPRAAVSADRIAEVLEAEPTVCDPEQPKSLPRPVRGAVEFQNVSFRYPGADEDVLHDISFTALPGQTTAFIGSTGSGKSTIVNLLPRFYDVTEGAILLDGVDVREITQHDLRDQIGYVPQKGVLFSGTIESNLRYADENAGDETLRTAAEVAQAAQFIHDRPEGFDAPIAQGGANVSGGQKQRLSIARALVKRPPIYVFDDSFSALDFQTEAALRRAIREQTGDHTVLIVTQRVSTIKNAEQIIVLDEGKIVGKGAHEELMQSCEAYQEIALSQLSMEELA
jgi:ATP-binding cassette, subfamily B, multidrug efflux pump